MATADKCGKSIFGVISVFGVYAPLARVYKAKSCPILSKADEKSKPMIARSRFLEEARDRKSRIVLEAFIIDDESV